MKRLLLLAVALAGCGSGNGNYSGNTDGSPSGSDSQISEQPLAGRVGGQDWSLGTGETRSALSGGDTYWADLYPETFAPCSGGGLASTHHLILNVPKATGDYPLSLAFNQTFVIETSPSTTDNFVATRGRLVITEITATVIRGQARIQYNADNSVEGSFEATICP